MKLLFCRACSDVVKLTREIRRCQCGASRGRYIDDDWHAEVWGESVEVVGLRNDSLMSAVRVLDSLQGSVARGPDVQAFLFPRVHERAKRMGKWRM